MNSATIDIAASPFSRSYRQALENYLRARSGEVALMDAYELGRRAVAEHRNVCLVFTSNSVALTQVAGGSACPGTAPGNNLANAANVTPYRVSSSNASLSGYGNFSFNALGQPSAAQTITVSGYVATPIRVEAETGYVH